MPSYPSGLSRRRRSAVVLTAAFMVLVPMVVVAQTVTDPRVVSFSPSSDDATILSDGRPAVDHYELGFYTIGASQPFEVMDLGKPGVGSDGTIQVDFVNYLQSWPPAGVVYEGRVSAVGPAGIALSSPSNSFTFSGPCTYHVSTPPASAVATGGSGGINVTSGAGCGWTASSSANWLSLGSDGGTGSGSVSYAIASNPSTSPRSAIFTVAGRTFTIAQSGHALCTYSATASRLSFAAAGGAGKANVTAGSGCSWNAASPVNWITVGNSGSAGNGSAAYTVAANSSASLRFASITVAGKLFTISQAAAAVVPPVSAIVTLGTWRDLPIPADYDGDGKTDPAVFGKLNAVWQIRRSSDGVTFSMKFGAPLLGDTPVPADYDGDGKADIAVFRKKTAEWFVRRSSDLGLTLMTWGAPNKVLASADTPVPGDYDGDGRADFAVFQKVGARWLIHRSLDGASTTIPWGAPALKDLPVAADYDGDHKTDIAVYRSTTGAWYIRRSTDGGRTSFAWGSPPKGDVAVPADYDGDGKVDIAVFRRRTSQWLVASSLGTSTLTIWGVAADVPVPGTYAGAPTAMLAVWHPITGVWKW